MEQIKSFVFPHDNKLFVGRTYFDDGQEPPWDREDGHGPVRVIDARHGLHHTGIKRPGERVLHSDRGAYWLYDWQEASKIARRDGWGGDNPVQEDFDRLRGFLKEDWFYVGVGVVQCSEDGEFSDEDRTFYRNAVWGIESDSDYYLEVAKEIARGIAS